MSRVTATRIAVIASIFVLSVTALSHFSKKSDDKTVDTVTVHREASPQDSGPMIALVLDDLGYSDKNLEGIKNIGAPITLAVLPDTPFTTAVNDFAVQNGLEVILHMPMEPESREVNLERNTIHVGMRKTVVENNIDISFNSVPSAVGMSNHMGSRATGDEELMSIVLADIKKRGMFFFDSLTAKRSKCSIVSEKLNVPYLKRDIFIDNLPEREYIVLQMEKAADLARSRGKAIAIGHDRSLTIEVLNDIVPGLIDEGIRFVFLSDLITGETGQAE